MGLLRRIADRFDPHVEQRAAIERGFLITIGRRPTAAERAVAERLNRRDFCRMLVCLNEFVFVE